MLTQLVLGMLTQLVLPLIQPWLSRSRKSHQVRISTRILVQFLSFAFLFVSFCPKAIEMNYHSFLPTVNIVSRVHLLDRQSHPLQIVRVGTFIARSAFTDATDQRSVHFGRRKRLWRRRQSGQLESSSILLVRRCSRLDGLVVDESS